MSHALHKEHMIYYKAMHTTMPLDVIQYLLSNASRLYCAAQQRISSIIIIIIIFIVQMPRVLITCAFWEASSRVGFRTDACGSAEARAPMAEFVSADLVRMFNHKQHAIVSTASLACGKTWIRCICCGSFFRFHWDMTICPEGRKFFGRMVIKSYIAKIYDWVDISNCDTLTGKS